MMARPPVLLLLISFLVIAVSSAAQRSSQLVVQPGYEAEILRLEDRREYGHELEVFLTSDDSSVRRCAAIATGRIGDAAAVEPLGALLRDSEKTVRIAAAFALGEIEDSTAAETIALFLKSEREDDPQTRAYAIEALGKLQATQHAALCVAALEDREDVVREAACLASWQMHAADAAEKLLALTEDRSDDLRWKATYALMRMIGSPASGRTSIPGGTELTPEIQARVEAAMIARAIDPDARIRLTALRGLKRLDEAETAKVVRECLEDPDWRVRVQAIRSVAGYFTERSSETGVSPRGIDLGELLEDDNPNVRLAAIEALGTPGARANPELLLRPLLGSVNPREIQVAALSLGRLWSAEEDEGFDVTEPVVELAGLLIEDEDRLVRASAAELLQTAGIYDSLLYVRLLRDDPRVAKLAIEPHLSRLAAGRQSDSPVIPALQPDLDRLLDSADPIMRAVTLDAAARVLGDTIDTHDVADWISLLRRTWLESSDEPGNDLRLTITGLTEQHTEWAPIQQILKEASEDEDELIRREAVRIQMQAGLVPSESADGPIETGRSLEEYAAILEWAKEEQAVEIVTPRGTIRISLFPRAAPLTCWNFTRLAESGFYDGGNWHRVVPNFVVQDGCPRGDGWGGPGYQIRCEINEHRYGRGAVGMALSGKDTGGSQFFITHSPQPHLDGRYTVFGRVDAGIEVVNLLMQGDRIDSIRLVSGK